MREGWRREWRRKEGGKREEKEEGKREEKGKGRNSFTSCSDA